MQEMSIYYYRISSGKKSAYYKAFLEGSFIAVDFNLKQDLTHHHYEDWREFNHLFIPIYLSMHPQKSKIAAGLACGIVKPINPSYRYERTSGTKYLLNQPTILFFCV